MCRRLVVLAVWILLSLPGSSALANSSTTRAKYILLIVWDGMRPDFVTPELTPTLHALRQEGVWFANHRSVYPTSTEVNGTVLATGLFPQRNGISANKEYRPEIEPLKQIGTQALPAVRRGDALTGGKYLRAPTVAELVQQAGQRTAVSGAKPVALLHDRLPRPADSQNPVWFAGDALPEKLAAELTNQLGSFPAAKSPNTDRDIWATRCLTEIFWAKELPRYSVLWLSEPDFSQHRHGPGSPQALAAIRSCDQRLATILAELERRKVRADTDIFIVSDHGFSTIGQNGDVAQTLRAAGINARPTWDEAPKSNDVVVVGNGGSVLLYVVGKSTAMIEKIAAVLQQNPNTGVLFTRAGIPGTFALAEARLDSATAPDLIVASGWKTTAPQDGHPRNEITNDGYTEYQPGGGMHVTLCPTDLHNTAIAVGPDFQRGKVSSLPSGNVDIAPTVLWLLNLQPPQPLDGRILFEALIAEATNSPVVKPARLETHQEFPNGRWEQHLEFTEVNGVRYLDEGNGRWLPKAVAK